MKRALLLGLLLLQAPGPAWADVPPSAQTAPEPSRLGWLLPGGGQFSLGQNGLGTAYALSTAGLAGWAVAAERDRASGELNAPLIYASHVYVLSITAAYRDLRLRSPDLGGPPVDPASNAELAAAPFKWSVFKSPWVWGCLVAGAGLNYIATREKNPGFGNISQMSYLGGTYSRNEALAVYTGYWTPLSLGAGVAEESLFRGVFQNDFERRWGPTRGLWAASALFGAAHLTDFTTSSLVNVGFGFLGGLYFGSRYQANDYRLSESVAAHFWFDFAAGLAIFLANPKENPLGARIQFGF